MKTIEFVQIQPGELTELINAAVADAMAKQSDRQASDAAGLSLNRAARLAHRRTQTVQQALESGALPGRRYGISKTRPRWSVVAADVRAWLAAGCPVVKGA